MLDLDTEEDEDEEFAEVEVEEEIISSTKKLEISLGKRKGFVIKEGMAKRQRGDPMTSDSASQNEKPETPSIPQDIPENTGDSNISFLELQEANNISKAAYKELMIMALKAKTWILATPALGSLEEFLQIFRSPPTPGMIVECSVDSAIVPISAESLVSYMVDMDRWAALVSNIVHRGSIHTPTGILKLLSSTDGAIKHVCMVNAEFQLPTSFVPTRRFKFLRCVRQITPDIWAIVDLSDDYFPHGSEFVSEENCRRRPSGLIVRRHGSFSKVIWIENVEVHDFQLEDNIYSGMIKSKSSFSAKLWLNTLIWRLKRKESRLVNVKMTLYQDARSAFLNLAQLMKMQYKDIVDESPDERSWVVISNRGVRVLRNLILDQLNPDSKYYIGVTSFRIEAKPRTVYNFLRTNNVEFEWPGFHNVGRGPEEVVRLASSDDSNSITLHKNTVISASGRQVCEFLLQEASMDGFCSYVISSPMDQLEVNGAFFFGTWGDNMLLMPSGFAIVPDVSDSNSSLVSIVIQQECPDPEVAAAIQFVAETVDLIIEEIHDEIDGGSKV